MIKSSEKSELFSVIKFIYSFGVNDKMLIKPHPPIQKANTF